MKTLVIAMALAALLPGSVLRAAGTGPEEIPAPPIRALGSRGAGIAPAALARMGLCGVQPLTDLEASQVRSSPCPVYYSIDGGSFQVLIAHALGDQYNFLYTSGFAAALFAPIHVPLGAGFGAGHR